MHYYIKNISDFNNATRHLTRQERSIYSDLLELQYDIECPIPNDIEWICRRIVARSESERTDVERMLNEYFDLVEQGWSNARAQAEIEHFMSKREKAIMAGKASGAARKRNKKPIKNNKKDIERKHDERTFNERSTDVEPTNNQQPTTITPPIPPQRGGRKTKIPENFLLSEKMKSSAIAYWVKKGRLDLIPEEIFDDFVTDAMAKGKRFENWEMAWKTWYCNAIKFNHGGATSGRGQASGKQTGGERHDRATAEYLESLRRNDG